MLQAMVRIGGKGMTSNRYVVLNCPTLMGNRLCYSKVIKQCADCTDCVIKQVIEACKREAVINYPKKEKEFITVNGYQAILNMFDIEEINK